MYDDTALLCYNVEQRTFIYSDPILIILNFNIKHDILYFKFLKMFDFFCFNLIFWVYVENLHNNLI